LIARDLAAMDDPVASIEKSIKMGWQGVFPPDNPTNGRRRDNGAGLDYHLDQLKARLAVQRLE
jgi:hypothetical protein